MTLAEEQSPRRVLRTAEVEAGNPRKEEHPLMPPNSKNEGHQREPEEETFAMLAKRSREEGEGPWEKNQTASKGSWTNPMGKVLITNEGTHPKSQGIEI